MDPAAEFVFDLQGYVRIPGVLSPAEVAVAIYILIWAVQESFNSCTP